MNLNDLSKEDKETNAIIGTIAQALLNDMASTADLRVSLSEQVGYDRGRNEGYKEGYAAAQAEMRAALFGVQFAAGMFSKKEEY